MIISRLHKVAPFVLLWMAFSVELFAKSKNKEQKKILTSITPIALIVKEISAGSEVEIEVLLEPGTDLHRYSLKFSDLKRLNKTSAFIWYGPQFEPFNKKKIPNQNLAIGELALSNTSFTSDPHFWLDPLSVILVARKIQDFFENLAPEYGELSRKNLSELEKNIDLLHKQTQRYWKETPNSFFIVFHNAISAYVGRYGLNQIGELNSSLGHDHGIKNLSSLADADADCLLADIQELPEAKKMAAKFKIPLVSYVSKPKLSEDLSYVEFIQTFTSDVSRCFQ